MVRIAAALKWAPGAIRPYRLASAILMALLLTASAGTASADMLASACARTYEPQTLDMSQPLNLGQIKLQIYFYVCSGAYDSELNKVLADAQSYVEKRAGEVSKPAVVLDIDETSLSNLPQELANDFGYIPNVPDPKCDALPMGPCGFNDWVMSTRAKAIPGMLSLFKAAKAHNVAVFFVTGRDEHEMLREATIKNLENAGYSGWDALVLRPAATKHLSIAGYKSGERAKIAAQGYTIIANIGDQQSDLAGGYAERAYKLPNPMYYLP